MHSFPVDVICGCLASFVLTILLPDSPLGAAPLPLHGLGELEQLGGVALAQGGGRERVGQAEGEEHLMIVKIDLEKKSIIFILSTHLYLAKLFNNDVRSMEAVGGRQYLAELLGGGGEGEASAWEHELSRAPVHLGLEWHLQ